MPRICVSHFAQQDRLVAETLATMFGKKFVTLTSNGLAALFTTLQSTVPRGEPVTTSLASTCSAIVNAIKAADLPVVFADMDPATLSMPDSAGTTALAGDDRHAVISDISGRGGCLGAGDLPREQASGLWGPGGRVHYGPLSTARPR